jgi:hypothetical protein
MQLTLGLYKEITNSDRSAYCTHIEDCIFYSIIIFVMSHMA